MELKHIARKWKADTVGGAEGWKTMPRSEMAKLLNKIESENSWLKAAEIVPTACLSKTGKQTVKPGEVRPIAFLPTVYSVWSSVRYEQLEKSREHGHTNWCWDPGKEHGYNKQYGQCCWKKEIVHVRGHTLTTKMLDAKKKLRLREV